MGDSFARTCAGDPGRREADAQHVPGRSGRHTPPLLRLGSEDFLKDNMGGRKERALQNNVLLTGT